MPKVSGIAKVLGAMAVLGAGGYYASRAMRPRDITVEIVSDYSFRFNHSDWTSVIENRMQELNHIYATGGTGVRWKVLSADKTDPTAGLTGLDQRRFALTEHIDAGADVLIAFTGIHERDRTGTANPFTRVAVVVDFPDKSQSQNSLLLAREMTHLFGAHDPAPTPESGRLSDRTVRLVHDLRNYDFTNGVDGLLEDSWGKKAADALAESDTGTDMPAAAHAEDIVGLALLNERRWEPAVSHLKEAVRLAPNSPKVRMDYALSLTRAGNDDGAMEQLKEAVRVAPNDPSVHQSLGGFLVKMRRPAQALEELNLAAKLDPKNAVAQVMIGTVLGMQMGRTEEAAAAFQEAMRLDPTSTLAAQEMDQLETAQAQVKERLAVERENAQKSPGDAIAHYRLGVVEGRAGNIAEAILEVKRSLEINPRNGSAHTELASLYYLKGDYPAAWQEIKKASALGVKPASALTDSLTAKMPEPK